MTNKEIAINEVVEEYLKWFIQNTIELESRLIQISDDGYEKNSLQELIDKYSKESEVKAGFLIYANDTKSQMDLFIKKVDTCENLGIENEIENVSEKLSFIKSIEDTANEKYFRSSEILNYPEYFLYLSSHEWKYKLVQKDYPLIAEESLLKTSNYNVVFAGEILFFQYLWYHFFQTNINFSELKINLPEKYLSNQEINSFKIDSSVLQLWFTNSLFPKDYKSNCKSDQEFIDNVNDNTITYYTNCLYNIYHLLCFCLHVPSNPELRISESNVSEVFKYKNLIEKSIFQRSINDETDISDKKPIIYNILVALDTIFQKISDDDNLLHKEMIYVWESIKANHSENFYVKKFDSKLSNLVFIHALSRFPIIPTAILNRNNCEGVVYDFVTYPLLISDDYEINGTSFVKDVSDYKLDKVVLLCNYVKPIWTNKLFLKKGYKFLFETHETIKGFALNHCCPR